MKGKFIFVLYFLAAFFCFEISAELSEGSPIEPIEYAKEYDIETGKIPPSREHCH